MISNIILPIVVCLLVTAAAYIYVPANKHKNTFIILTLIAAIIRIAIVIYLYSSGTEASGTDGLLYHREGIAIARQLADGVPFYNVKYSYTWYTVFVGLIYHIFGVNRYLVSYINILLAIFSAILILKMALNHKYKFVNAAFISLAFLYFPNMFIWTADSRKESLLIFVCFLSWYLVQRLTLDITARRGSVALHSCRIALVCLLLWLSTLIRVYMFIPLAAGILISQLLLYKKTLSRLSIAFALTVAVSSIIIFFATMNPLTDGYHAISFANEPSSVSTTQQVTSKMETVKTIASNRNIVSSTLNYVLLPYPGAVNIADLHGNKNLEFIVSLDMMAWYICLILMLSGIYSTLKKKDSCFMGLIVFLAVYIFINAAVVENVQDTIYRYRSVIVGLSLLLIDGDVLGNLYSRFEYHFVGRFPGDPLYRRRGRGTGTLTR